jgi:hypothetical protein
MAFQSSDFEHTWWRLFQKYVVRTKFDIHIVEFRFCAYKKDAHDSQPQVIKFTSYLPMVGGSLRVLRLFPLLKLVAVI